MRYLVYGRDRGVCARCQVDTQALKNKYYAIKKQNSHGFDIPDIEARAAFREAHGVPASRVSGDWWDADHITPVIEGGGECGLENYRTLCIPCHREVTKELHARRAKTRRAIKRDERDAQRGLLQGL